MVCFVKTKIFLYMVKHMLKVACNQKWGSDQYDYKWIQNYFAINEWINFSERPKIQGLGSNKTLWYVFIAYVWCVHVLPMWLTLSLSTGDALSNIPVRTILGKAPRLTASVTLFSKKNIFYSIILETTLNRVVRINFLRSRFRAAKAIVVCDWTNDIYKTMYRVEIFYVLIH